MIDLDRCVRDIFLKNLDEELKMRSMSRQALADGIGISWNTIANWYTKKKSCPNVENIIKIAVFLNVSIDTLVDLNHWKEIPKDELFY